MRTEATFLAALEQSARAANDWDRVLAAIIDEFAADSGTIHILGRDGVLHLKAASAGIPQVVLDIVRDVPVGKGMAGLAVERKRPVNACNIQTRRRQARRASHWSTRIGSRAYAARRRCGGRVGNCDARRAGVQR